MDLTSNESLGFPPDARLLIVNCDDFGMHQAINTAVIASIEEGIAVSCSLMPVCPGAADAMRLLRQRPEIPAGIHLTLTCETPGYRWGPLTAREKVPSLLDATGELFAEIGGLLAQARLDEVEAEFRAQIEAVLAAGLSPTHLDWHCLADGGREEIFDLTVALAGEYGLAARVWLEPSWTASPSTSTASRPGTPGCCATCRRGSANGRCIPVRATRSPRRSTRTAGGCAVPTTSS
jgi:predicted glycoside hydrolase/deacetylase ChbG (UPF0249 family)